MEHAIHHNYPNATEPGKRIFLNVLLFILFFGVTILTTYVIRLFTLGFYKRNSNYRILRKYVEAQNWLSGR